MDGDARVLVRVLAVLGRDGVLLHGHGLAGVEAAVLEHDRRVPEDEVHGPVHVALPEELPVRVDVQGVLVPNDVAPVDHRVIRPNAEGHGLVLRGTGPVLERDVPSDEPGSGGSCTRHMPKHIIKQFTGH